MGGGPQGSPGSRRLDINALVKIVSRLLMNESTNLKATEIISSRLMKMKISVHLILTLILLFFLSITLLNKGTSRYQLTTWVLMPHRVCSHGLCECL